MSFRHLVLEALEGIVHFDSKLYRTVATLLFKPGLLSAEFRDGRRARFVPPVRLYIFISFVFFFLLAIGSGKHESPETPPSTSFGQTESPNHFQISFYDLHSTDLVGKSDAQIDSVMAAHKIENTPFKKFLARQLGRIAAGGRSEFNHVILKGISYMMFVLMPLFALFVYLVHRHQNRFYLDCLVFSVHYHSFVFLLLAVYVLYARMAGFGLAVFVPFALTAYYLYASLRKFYPQSRIRATAKTMVVGVLHLASILGCFMLMVLVNVLLF